MGFNQSRLAPGTLCHSAQQLRHHHQVKRFCWSTVMACGTSATALLGPLVLISRVQVPHGRLLHQLWPILWAKDNVQLLRLACRSQQNIEINCPVHDTCSRNNAACIKARSQVRSVHIPWVGALSPSFRHNQQHSWHHHCSIMLLELN